MEGRYEYIQQAVTDSQKEAILLLKFGSKLKYSHRKIKIGYKGILYIISDL
jgi:hypothetical protein